LVDVTSGGSNQRLSPDRAAAQRVRESAFARIGRVRGATVIGAGALTAAIAGVVSAVAPGRTLGAKAPSPATATSSSATRARTTTLVMPPLDNPSQLGLQGPASPPQSSQSQGTQPQPQVQTQTQSAPAPAPQSAPAPVVSGGS
jgi:hypothetical protein